MFRVFLVSAGFLLGELCVSLLSVQAIPAETIDLDSAYLRRTQNDIQGRRIHRRRYDNPRAIHPAIKKRHAVQTTDFTILKTSRIDRSPLDEDRVQRRFYTGISIRRDFRNNDRLSREERENRKRQLIKQKRRDYSALQERD